jgi:hypothetical protein
MIVVWWWIARRIVNGVGNAHDKQNNTKGRTGAEVV